MGKPAPKVFLSFERRRGMCLVFVFPRFLLASTLRKEVRLMAKDWYFEGGFLAGLLFAIVHFFFALLGLEGGGGCGTCG